MIVFASLQAAYRHTKTYVAERRLYNELKQLPNHLLDDIGVKLNQGKVEFINAQKPQSLKAPEAAPLTEGRKVKLFALHRRRRPLGERAG